MHSDHSSLPPLPRFLARVHEGGCDPTFILDGTGEVPRIVWMNGTMATVLDLPPIDPHDLELGGVVPPEGVAQAMASISKVRETGRPMAFTGLITSIPSLRHATVTLHPIDEGGQHVDRFLGKVEMLLITQQRFAAERCMRDLDRALAASDNAAELERYAVDSLGSFLQVDGCGFIEVDGDKATIGYLHRHSDRCPVMTGSHSLNAGPVRAFAGKLRKGEALVMDDLSADPAAGIFAGKGIGSFAIVPIMRRGKWVAALGCMNAGKRRWTSHELEVIEDHAVRAWPAIERARAITVSRILHERFSAAQRAARCGVWEVDHATGEVILSPEFRLLMGLGPEEKYWMGEGDRFSIPEDVEMLRNSHRQVLEQRLPEWSASYRFMHPEKGLRWQFSRGDVTYDEHGRPLRMVGISIDITEQKRAEEELKMREAQARHYAAIIENSEDAIISKDTEGRVLSWNRGAEMIFGYTAQEMAGRTLENLIPRDRREEEPGILARVLKGEHVEHYETVRLTKTKERVDVAISVSPVKDEQGVIIGAAKIARDITSRKRVERAMREADKRKNEFLATLAHELRNPLAPLMNGIELLRGHEVDHATRTEAFSMMDRQLRQMVRLIDDLLDISRISRGHVELRKEVVDMRAVLEQAIETSRPLIDRAQHRLRYVPPKNALHVNGDPTRLAQVFSNLLNNAAKYTPAEGTITIDVKNTQEEVVVEVRDSGVGIPLDELENIFEMFTQLEGSRSILRSGLGIGLSIARQLVMRHGGSITAGSAGPGHGSSFTVRLPLAQEIPAGTAATEAPTRTSHRRLRVLVVDDNVDAALTMAMVIERLGHETVIAHDGSHALQVGGIAKPDLVLMDIGMPGLNGHDTCRTLRTTGWGGGCKVIAVTGWGQESDKQRALASGFDDHVTKPVDRATLQNILAEAAIELDQRAGT